MGGPLRQGRGELGAEWMKRRRPRGPFGSQALVALHAAGDVLDGFALLAMGRTVALVE